MIQQLDLSNILSLEGLSSKVNDFELGSYSHKYLSIQVNHELDTYYFSSEYVKEYIRNNPSPESQIKEAFRQVTLLHELKHYFDSFSTYGGITLFGTYLIELKEFIILLTTLKRKKIPVKLPLWEWGGEATCPDIVKEFLEKHQLRNRLRILFTGGFQVLQEEGFSEETWRQGIFPQMNNLEIPVFPLRSIQFIDSSKHVIQKKSITSWQLLGFKSLVESGAFAFQMSYVEDMWPAEISSEMRKALRRSEKKINVQEARKNSDNSTTDIDVGREHYEIVDQFVTKFLLKKYGYKNYERNALTKLIDMSLMVSVFPDKLSDLVSKQPAQVLVEILKSSEWSKTSGSFERDYFINTNDIESYIEKIAKVQKPAFFDEKYSKSPPSIMGMVHAIESYVSHNIVIPLLQIRLNHGHDVFWNFDKFLYSGILPDPSILILPNRIGFKPSPVIQSCWIYYAMLANIHSQLMSGVEIIDCPRAYERIPGASKINFADTGNCKEFIAKQACMTWNPHTNPANFPSCSFRQIIKTLGLDNYRWV